MSKSFIKVFQDFFAPAKKPWERKQSKGTGSAEQVPLEFPWGFFGILAFKAKMLHTHKAYKNAPPTTRRGYFGVILPASYRHGRLLVAVIFLDAPTDGSADRGDPVEGDLKGNDFPKNSPLLECERARNLAPKPQKQKPPRSVRSQSAQLGVSVRTNSDRGEAILHQKQNCPLFW